MTLSAYTPDFYDGDGVTVDFDINFVFWEDSDVKVIHTDSAGVETTWVDGTQYTQTGGSGAVGAIAVETAPTDYTPDTGEKLTIKSALADTQGESLTLGGPFPSTTVERMGDKTVRLIQQRSEETGRSLRLPESSTFSDLTLEDPVALALVRWKSDLSGLENAVLDDLSFSTVGSFSTTADPTVNSDGANSDGNGTFSINSLWTNTTTDKVWVCANVATGAAVWKEQNAEGDAIGVTTPAVANFTTLGLSGDLTFSQADPEILGGDTNGKIIIGAGVTNILGGSIHLYGDTHATKAQDIEFYANATLVGGWDESAGTWDFNNIDGTIIGANTPAEITGTALVLGSTEKLHLDGSVGGNTYIYESGADTLDFIVGGSSSLSMSTSSFVIGSGLDFKLAAAKKLYLDGGSNTYIWESAADDISFVTGNTEAFLIDQSQNCRLSVSGASTYIGGSLIVNAAQKLYLDGGSNTYIHEASADKIELVTGNTVALSIYNNQEVEFSPINLRFKLAQSTGSKSVAAGFVTVTIGGVTRYIQTYSS